MSTTTIRILAGLVLIIHGIGHVMALLPAFNIASTEGWHYRSWLLTGILGESFSRVLVVILFGIPMIGFIAAGMGLLGWLVPQSAWQPLALGSAVLSLVALALFWNAFVMFIPNKVGAIAVNLATLWVVLGAGTFAETLKSVT
ncbi:MAG: hypothetical protein ACK2UW_19970 [Anaerolineales bacterium]|jgi:hypothetical protein